MRAAEDVRLHLQGALAGQEHVTALGFVQAVDAAQERGLAGAGRADDAGGGARGHVEADVAEHFNVAVGHGQVLQFQAGALELLDVRVGWLVLVALLLLVRFTCCSR